MESRPIFNSMTKKFTESFQPKALEITDESSKHAEHEAMLQSGFKETHFKIVIVSDAFKDRPLIQRHRMVYALIDNEFKNGLHAINMTTQTPEEYEKTVTK